MDEPWASSTPIEVAFQVITEGKRLPIPEDTEEPYARLMKMAL